MSTMGAIRTVLNLGTAGAVDSESKKQRYARTAAGIPSRGQRSAEGWQTLGALCRKRHQAPPDTYRECTCGATISASAYAQARGWWFNPDGSMHHMDRHNTRR
jgi:hypothetical protein